MQKLYSILMGAILAAAALQGCSQESEETPAPVATDNTTVETPRATPVDAVDGVKVLAELAIALGEQDGVVQARAVILNKGVDINITGTGLDGTGAPCPLGGPCADPGTFGGGAITGSWAVTNISGGSLNCIGVEYLGQQGACTGGPYTAQLQDTLDNYGPDAWVSNAGIVANSATANVAFSIGAANNSYCVHLIRVLEVDEEVAGKCPAICGNGTIETGEGCDAGAGNGSTTCGCQGTCQFTANGTPAPDGAFCNGNETCNGAGGVTPGTPPACDDGAFCNGTETCNEGTDSCDPGVPPACNDGLGCNGLETCNEGTDSCDPGTPLNCDDSVACTVDSCSEPGLCNNVPNNALCDNGLFCDGVEICNVLSGCQDSADPCAESGGGSADCTEVCREANDDCQGNDPDGSACNNGTNEPDVDTCSSGVCTDPVASCSITSLTLLDPGNGRTNGTSPGYGTIDYPTGSGDMLDPEPTVSNNGSGAQWYMATPNEADASAQYTDRVWVDITQAVACTLPPTCTFGGVAGTVADDLPIGNNQFVGYGAGPSLGVDASAQPGGTYPGASTIAVPFAIVCTPGGGGTNASLNITVGLANHGVIDVPAAGANMQINGYSYCSPSFNGCDPDSAGETNNSNHTWVFHLPAFVTAATPIAGPTRAVGNEYGHPGGVACTVGGTLGCDVTGLPGRISCGPVSNGCPSTWYMSHVQVVNLTNVAQPSGTLTYVDLSAWSTAYVAALSVGENAAGGSASAAGQGDNIALATGIYYFP